MEEKKVKKSKNAESRCIIISIVCVILINLLYYYFSLPALNIHYGGFWFWMVLILIEYLIIKNVVFGIMVKKKTGVSLKNINIGAAEVKETSIRPLLAILMILAFMLIGAIAGSALFRAKTYSSLITVTERDFKEDMPETTEVTNIALMDTESARVIGKRALGNLSEVVSQYELSETYSQINYKGSPEKISCLEYNGFFKWINNKDAGIPGYVMVDPVNNTAEYIKLSKGLKYAESGYFGDYLYRKLRFSYPTKMFGSCYFEIDDEGNPFYVISCMKANAGLFGAKDVSEVIIFDPVNGDSSLYKVGNVPSWVDIVYSGDLACDKYNWYGDLSGGFWNSVIGQKGCRVTTDDYGYLMFDDDVWYYTGVTSVLSDESNIGFILTNARTGEYRYYSIVGAEEYSAMSAAQGEVQEKGYKASFPSLINVADEASYICVLKDNSGLVKLYALVNVENYSLVATGESQSSAIAAYKRLLISKGVLSEDTQVIDVEDNDVSLSEISVRAEAVRFADISGSTWIYIKGDDGKLYKAKVADDESVMLIGEEDELVLMVTEADEKGIRTFKEWKYK